MKHKTQIHVKENTCMTKLNKKHQCKTLVITKQIQTKTATCHICNKNIYCKKTSSTFIFNSFNLLNTNINILWNSYVIHICHACTSSINYNIIHMNKVEVISSMLSSHVHLQSFLGFLVQLFYSEYHDEHLQSGHFYHDQTHLGVVVPSAPSGRHKQPKYVLLFEEMHMGNISYDNNWQLQV